MINTYSYILYIHLSRLHMAEAEDKMSNILIKNTDYDISNIQICKL